MKKLFESVEHLDKSLIERFDLSEDLMMEHAAESLNRWTRKHLKKGKKVQIVCGLGNNGADGIAAARMLHEDYKVSILLPLGVKSKMAKLQLQRAKKLNIKIDEKIKKAHLYIDAIFGSGLDRELHEDIINIIKKINSKKALKLACDVPTGIMKNGNVLSAAFKADATISMGALKTSLFSDFAKEYTGKIKTANLGLSRQIYEQKSENFLLEKKDLKLPFRKRKNTNKGDFGHLVVISGEKSGASILCAKAAFAFGTGLLSLYGKDLILPNHLMKCDMIPKNTTAIACGMGLGKLDENLKNILIKTPCPLVLDADILSFNEIKEILNKKENIILTPHPKEFSSLCKVLDFGDFTAENIQANRFEFARKFSLQFPHVLVLKGANTIISYKGKCFVSSFGTPALSKGGSGDVLAGFIASLLAQGYSLLDSAINGVLAHGKASRKIKQNNYSLEPNDIIKAIKYL